MKLLKIIAVLVLILLMPTTNLLAEEGETEEIYAENSEFTESEQLEEVQTELLEIPTEELIEEEVSEFTIPEGTEITGEGELINTQKELNFKFPNELLGYSVNLIDDEGNILTSQMIDSTGLMNLKLDELMNSYNLTFTSGKLKTLGRADKNKTIDFELFLLYLLITSLITFALSFYLGRYSCLRLLKDLRDYIYEEELD